jgi:membrane protein insertase Oxa1/YidC/SpoIIIJ
MEGNEQLLKYVKYTIKLTEVLVYALLGILVLFPLWWVSIIVVAVIISLLFWLFPKVQLYKKLEAEQESGN